MKKQRILFLAFLFCSLHLLAQETTKSRNQYDYFKGRFRIGYTLGRYNYHLSGPEIYMYRVNNGYVPSAQGGKRYLSIDDKFTPLQSFRGIHIGFEGGEENIRYEFYFTTRKNTSDAKYSYDNGDGTEVITEHEKVRIRYNAITFGAGYRFEKIPQLTIGACVDIGILRTEHKLSSSGNKWEPWFYSFKILGSGIKPNAPVATYGLFLNFDIGPVSLKLVRNFTFLDGDLNSETYKYTNIPWSSKNFPMANTSLTAAIKI